MYEIISAGNLELMKQMYWKHTPIDQEEYIILAAKHEYTDILQFMHSQYVIFNPRILYIAIEENDIKAIKCLVPYIPVNALMVQNAIFHGYIDLVKYLIQHTHKDIGYITTATKMNHKELVYYLVEQGYPVHHAALEYAAERGLYDLVTYLYNHTEATQLSIYFAALSGYLEIVQYLCDRNPELLINFNITNIIERGNYDIIHYLHSRGVTVNSDMISIAAFYGYLHIIKFLHSVGVIIPRESLSIAAANNQFDTLEYLLQYQSPDETVITRAAENGHLKLVEYLHHINAPIDETAIANAARNGHLDVVSYLFENGAPIDRRAIDNALNYGHYYILEYFMTPK
jgi:ankyrin repeat protein